MPGGGCARYGCPGGAAAGSGSARSTPPRARRAHDAAMLAINAGGGGGGGACCLNFADSAWLLAVPRSYRTLADVRHAVAEAVEDFFRRRLADDALSATSSSSTTPSTPRTDDEEESAATDGDESSSPASDLAFELDVLSDMGWDLYYASLAQGMLMEPPSAALGDDGDAILADVPLWSY